MEIEARHLRLVKAVAEARSISGAAPLLRMTQPALTRQLRRIEHEVGAELFHRSRDGVEPTELGRLVVGRADAVLSVMDSLQADLDAAVNTDRPEQVRIGVRTGPVLLGLMRGLRETWPDVVIVADSEDRIGGLLELLATGRIDVAVIHEFDGFEIVLDQRLVSVAVELEEVFVAMSEDHPLATRSEVCLADLEEENWLLSPLDVDREADCFTACCAEAGYAPNLVHYVTDMLAYDLVRVGEAIAPSLPRPARRGIVVLPLTGSPIRVRHLLIVERSSPLVDCLDKLAAYVADAISEAQRPVLTRSAGPA